MDLIGYGQDIHESRRFWQLRSQRPTADKLLFHWISEYCAYTHNLKEKRGKTENKNFLSYVWQQESHTDQEQLNMILMVLV